MNTIQHVNRTFRPLVAVVLSLVMAGLWQSAAGKGTGSTTGFFAGKIQGVDVKARVLRVANDKSAMTFQVSPDAKIVGKDKKTATLGDLAAGEKVIVDYMEQEGLMVAQAIAVQPEEPPAPPTEATESVAI